MGSKADASLFIHVSSKHVIFILIYVDDIIITGSNVSAVNTLIKTLYKEFVVKDLGNLSFFLRNEELQSADGLYLTQRKYVVDLLKR